MVKWIKRLIGKEKAMQTIYLNGFSNFHQYSILEELDAAKEWLCVKRKVQSVKWLRGYKSIIFDITGLNDLHYDIEFQDNIINQWINDRTCGYDIYAKIDIVLIEKYSQYNVQHYIDLINSQEPKSDYQKTWYDLNHELYEAVILLEKESTIKHAACYFRSIYDDKDGIKFILEDQDEHRYVLIFSPRDKHLWDLHCASGKDIYIDVKKYMEDKYCGVL